MSDRKFGFETNLFRGLMRKDIIEERNRLQKTGDRKLVQLPFYDIVNTEQKDIYYLAAENKDMAEGSPHLEVFKKKKLDVLFLIDCHNTTACFRPH